MIYISPSLQARCEQQKNQAQYTNIKQHCTNSVSKPDIIKDSLKTNKK